MLAEKVKNQNFSGPGAAISTSFSGGCGGDDDINWLSWLAGSDPIVSSIQGSQFERDWSRNDWIMAKYDGVIPWYDYLILIFEAEKKSIEWCDSIGWGLPSRTEPRR